VNRMWPDSDNCLPPVLFNHFVALTSEENYAFSNVYFVMGTTRRGVIAAIIGPTELSGSLHDTEFDCIGD
jgi:hypothetical protein